VSGKEISLENINVSSITIFCFYTFSVVISMTLTDIILTVTVRSNTATLTKL
jgi:hypothetical protein